MSHVFEIPTLFNAAMARLHEVCGTRTQMQLAEFLGVRQSSISDAKRRQTIPDGWLINALRRTNVDPDWILTGIGERWRVLSDEYSRPVDRAEIEAGIRAELDTLDAGQLITRLRALLPEASITIGLGADKPGRPVESAPRLRAVGQE